MIRRIASRLRLFSRDTSASVVVDFAIMFPLFITMFLSGIEMGMMTVRQTMLERALDEAVRDLRIGDGTAPQHDAIREKICDYALVLPDCQNALKLELRSADLRAFASLGGEPDCVNRAEAVNPIRFFESGQRNSMMIMRACFKFSPIFPNIGMGAVGAKDTNGDLMFYATTAFVNEPS